ncbi:hypothetical protein J4Q44_G00327820 [Coregonus suidteri]|uniref:Uncharacterized protein n=1 Tax=Coregonus suidteri TaxID=861788 RepID=A0AAN8KWL2_9TELE
MTSCWGTQTAPGGSSSPHTSRTSSPAALVAPGPPAAPPLLSPQTVLNYLEVAREAQSCSAHFTALLYSEIYIDKIKTNMEENRRTQARTSHRITFDESSQNFTISSLTEESVKDTGISLQDLLIEVYRSIGEPDCMGVEVRR